MIRKAVIDSGPLFSALLLNYNERGVGPGRPRRFEDQLQWPLRNASAQREFMGLLAAIPEKLTTSHIIGELRGLGQSCLELHGDGGGHFWRTSMALLLEWNIDRTTRAPPRSLAGHRFRVCLPEIGAPDTGLIQLAGRHNCVLITDDNRMAREAKALQVECQLIQDLVRSLV